MALSPNDDKKEVDKLQKVFELSALIHGRFRTDSDFARHIGWPRQRLYKIVNGYKEPSLDEAIAIARGLEEPLERIANIFLRYKSPNGDKETRKN